MMTTLLNNRYQIVQVLGSGGFGETFLAEDTYLPSRRCCVIKQLKPVINDPKLHQLIQQRFQREAATLETLGEGSDQIPHLYAYFSENGQFYLVQEWIQGQTLTSKVAAEGPLSETAVREILVSLLQVLNYIHSKGIIYRDIKPDNVILRSSNNQPVLIDFGAVKETMATALNAQGKSTYTMILGTPGFMAPEQAVGRPVYASDIYSLGVTAIYLLTGKLPQDLEIDAQTEQLLWQQHVLNVSSSLSAVLDRAVQYQPRDRYTTAIKMLNELQAVPHTQPSTQATVAVPAYHKQVLNPAVESTQPASVVHFPSSQKNWQKNLIVGSLLVGGLLSAVAVAGFVRNQSLQSAASTSSPSQSASSQPIAQSTPVVAEPAEPAKPDSVPPTPAESPRLGETKLQQNQQQNTDPASASIEPIPQPENQPQDTEEKEITSIQPGDEQVGSKQLEPQPTADSVPQEKDEEPNESASDAANESIPGFRVGTSEDRVKAALGKPTNVSRGIWFNTRAVIYDVKPDRVTLGYLFDRTSGRLRQTEVSFAQSIEPQVMQATLQEILGANASGEINQGLQQVYQRRANKYDFRAGELKGVIERNQRDRIYIGVWEADLH